MIRPHTCPENRVRYTRSHPPDEGDRIPLRERCTERDHTEGRNVDLPENGDSRIDGT